MYAVYLHCFFAGLQRLNYNLDSMLCRQIPGHCWPGILIGCTVSMTRAVNLYAISRFDSIPILGVTILIFSDSFKSNDSRFKTDFSRFFFDLKRFSIQNDSRFKTILDWNNISRQKYIVKHRSRDTEYFPNTLTRKWMEM